MGVRVGVGGGGWGGEMGEVGRGLRVGVWVGVG